MKLVVPCPAKVNLFLAVGRKDRRGYHPLRTIFQAVGLYDTLTIDTDVSETSIVCNWPDMPADNTVAKAHRLLGELWPLPPMRIEIEKRIPAQSGLGGGSSDAAGFLRAMKKLFGGSVPDHELHSMAVAVGADVPFFLVGGRARAEGYGEKLTPLEDAPSTWLVIAKPRETSCSTVEAYRRLDEKAYEWRDFPEGDALYNDFERVAPCESLDLIERLQVLGAKDAALSGSGSAVFGRFGSKEDAERVELDAETWVAPILTRRESVRFG